MASRKKSALTGVTSTSKCLKPRTCRFDDRPEALTSTSFFKAFRSPSTAITLPRPVMNPQPVSLMSLAALVLIATTARGFLNRICKLGAASNNALKKLSSVDSDHSQAGEVRRFGGFWTQMLAGQAAPAASRVLHSSSIFAQISSTSKAVAMAIAPERPAPHHLEIGSRARTETASSSSLPWSQVRHLLKQPVRHLDAESWLPRLQASFFEGFLYHLLTIGLALRRALTQTGLSRLLLRVHIVADHLIISCFWIMIVLTSF